MRCSGERQQQHRGAPPEDERSRKALEHKDHVAVRRQKMSAAEKRWSTRIT